MGASIPNFPRRHSRGFREIVDAFLGAEGLPFAEVLSCERIEGIFQKHGCLFCLHGVVVSLASPSRLNWRGWSQ